MATRAAALQFSDEKLSADGFAALLFGALLDVIDDVANRLQLFGVLIRDFDGKLFLESHHQFHDVQGIRAQIFDERRLGRDLFGVDPELLDDDVFDLLLD